MKVILMLGNKSKVNAERLKKQVDSLDIDCYETVKEMIDNVAQRNLTFDRVVVSTATLGDIKTMDVLSTYLKEMHPRATVVLIFQKNRGDKLAELFNSTFNSPLYTDMGITTNSISILEESATASIDELRDKYSINKYGETEEDTLNDSYTSELGESKSLTKEDLLKGTPMLHLPQKKKQKKRSGIFGLKKFTKAEIEINRVNTKLVIDYVKYLERTKNRGDSTSKYSIPLKAKLSTSDTLKEGLTKMPFSNNEVAVGSESKQNLDNLIPNKAFTQIELGYYGFSSNYKGRPMAMRLGVRVSQEHVG